MSAVVRVEHVGTVARLLLDSPDNRNALSIQLRTELFEALREAAVDDDVRSIVIGHTGPVMCAGADLKEASSGSAPVGTPTVREILVEIWRSPKPVVAALGGVARAGGLGLVAACDVVIAAEPVTFACTEVRLGVVPAVISAVMLPRMARAAVHHLFLTGLPVSAQWARDAGLVDVVAPAGRLEDEVRRITDAFAKAAPGALAATKRLTRSESAIAGLEADLGELEMLSAQYFSAEEGREGIAAFMEKRPPAWLR
ncbi:enoyl-CoA hydratase-related protein [Mycobacterium sp. CVI_P3]|uniref:Enoyl-CoA hydratase-related protein n=1 Tax=Mycobacterium pinniadriaticum TaxID=2994102 RepID=A0ABT3SBZ2_9MYCO|nr:enoyl-CoA hydratase-related protein [Mycobacterium pinniadriaticum]MCX2930614.1 enoyl-CoA hydratase-related protein [Mycobacterium pinniadriaticum]MCX2937038.1 enoyl-CoA hydratase-related protein [Mycobacterium pinniadriaticum]